MYAEFELEARSKISQPDNDNVELIAYYADHAHLPQEALRVARLEMEQSHNVWVLDAYAWALFANGRYAEAGEQMQKALAVGTRDSVLYYHAGAIEAAIGKNWKASRYLQQSLDFNPASEVSGNQALLSLSLSLCLSPFSLSHARAEASIHRRGHHGNDRKLERPD